MSTVDEGQRADRSEFYAAQYARFESEVTSDIRREVYGEDIGQQGWRSFDEQTIIANLILESSPCHVLDVAGRQAMAQGLSHQARFEIADCSARLPYPDGTFDVVVCIDAVLHLKDRFAAIIDWERLLRPQGRVLFTDAAVITGSISIEELNIRASQGAF
jgi:SAM-dependent methyltransferase